MFKSKSKSKSKSGIKCNCPRIFGWGLLTALFFCLFIRGLVVITTRSLFWTNYCPNTKGTLGACVSTIWNAEPLTFILALVGVVAGGLFFVSLKHLLIEFRK